MPEPPLDTTMLDGLICSESPLPDSPALGTAATLVQATACSFPRDDMQRSSSRILLMNYDETLYGHRALARKLQEQKISLDVAAWGKAISTRREYWFRAYEVSQSINQTLS